MLHESAVKFSTVGKLRSLLDGLPDDRMIIAQVAAEDGTAWSMFPDFCPLAGDTFSVICLTHHQLKTMPPIG